MHTAFLVLGLPQSATHVDVKACYRSLARENHSDLITNYEAKKRADERMAEINVAYSLICNARGW